MNEKKHQFWVTFTPNRLSTILSVLGQVIQNGGGRVVQRCCVNFQCRGVLLIWLIVGQGPIALAVGAGGGCLDIFSLVYLLSFLSPPLGDGPI